MLSVVIIVVVSVTLSAFFSGMEIAFTSANRLRMEIDRKRGGVVGRIIERFASKPGEFITTMLVGNNIVLVIYSMFMTKLIHLLAERMGRMMQQMGCANRQVLSITHLPQVAALGSRHYKVHKEETANGT